jgi:hypothetical protein
MALTPRFGISIALKRLRVPAQPAAAPLLFASTRATGQSLRTAGLPTRASTVT